MTEPSGDPEGTVTWAVRMAADHKRYFADQAIAGFLGRDLEIILVQNSSVMQQVIERPIDGGTEREVKHSPLAVEVARFRLSPHGAVGLLTGLVGILTSPSMAGQDDDIAQGVRLAFDRALAATE